MLLGILFEACFFGVLLYLLSQKDVSLIWPLTSLGFLITALAARMVRTRTARSAVDRRGNHRDWRRTGRPERTNKEQVCLCKFAAGRCHAGITFSKTSASRSCRKFVFFCNSSSAPIFSPAISQSPRPASTKSRFLSGLASRLKSSGKSFARRVRNHAHRHAATSPAHGANFAVIAADSISTASAPVSSRSFFFSAIVGSNPVCTKTSPASRQRRSPFVGDDVRRL